MEIAKALSDPTRVAIMQHLCCKWLTVTQVVEQTGVTQPTVSHHLAVLRRAGLVSSRREGKLIWYTLNQQRVAAYCCQVAEDLAPEVELSQSFESES